jgi:hypothetical protein
MGGVEFPEFFKVARWLLWGLWNVDMDSLYEGSLGNQGYWLGEPEGRVPYPNLAQTSWTGRTQFTSCVQVRDIFEELGFLWKGELQERQGDGHCPTSLQGPAVPP